MMEVECLARRGRSWILSLAVAGAIAAACGPTAAADRSMDDLIGHWCGGPGVDLEYVFARDTLNVTGRHRKGRPNILHIARVEASPDWINIIWSDGGNTVYWKFSDDGRTVYKHANETGDKGPEQAFHRC